MTFPNTALQADFTTMADHGPPISGFVNPPGALNLGKMIVDTALAQADSADPDSPLGFALFDEVFGPSYEAYVKLGTLDAEGNFGGLGVFNEDGNDGYLVTWNSDGVTTGLIVSTLAGLTLGTWTIDNLSENDWIGFNAKSSKLTVYLKYGSDPWGPLGVVSGLSLPLTGRIGFGAIGIG